jgi:hypothetical protein
MPTEKSETGGQNESELIEGGIVQSMVDVEIVPKRHREATARMIAISLVGILAGSALLHFIAILVLAHDQANAMEETDKFFNAWLPVISGLVGSATTYYFTKDKS